MMKSKLVSLLILVFFVSQSNAQKYVIDPGHSSVQIQVERFGVVDVVGRFKDVSGNITYDESNASKTTADALIKVESYDANNAGGEDAVKSKAFLDAGTYAEISFKSKSVSNNVLTGDLTIHGVTNEVQLPFTIKGPLLDLPTRKQSIAATASVTINRQDYGISFDRKLPSGASIVGNDVKITLIVLALAE
ncbi:MAG: YceI family protein [Cyclobacteriaceae bacterium]